MVRKLAGSDGHLIWKRSYAGPANSFNQGSHLALDSTGNAYCTGYGQNAHGDSDIITCKFRSSDGHLQWARRIAGASSATTKAPASWCAGARVWVTGGEYTSAATRVVALAKYTLAGKRLWLHTWLERSRTTEYPNALAVDNHGNAVVVGAGTDNPVTREHAFILRYSAAGRLQWRRITFDSVSHEAAWKDVVCDTAGRIWVGGYAVNGSSDSFLVARYSAAGGRVWRSAWKGPDGLGGRVQRALLRQDRAVRRRHRHHDGRRRRRRGGEVHEVDLARAARATRRSGRRCAPPAPPPVPLASRAAPGAPAPWQLIPGGKRELRPAPELVGVVEGAKAPQTAVDEHRPDGEQTDQQRRDGRAPQPDGGAR